MRGDEGEGERTRPENFFNEFLGRNTKGRVLASLDAFGWAPKKAIPSPLLRGNERWKKEVRSEDQDIGLAPV